MMCFDWTNRIGIFYLNHEWANDVFNKIYKNIPQDAIKFITKNRHDMQIRLKDGSYIIFIPATDNLRGRVFDRIYYQDSISDEIINVQIRPMWHPFAPSKLEI